MWKTLTIKIALPVLLFIFFAPNPKDTLNYTELSIILKNEAFIEILEAEFSDLFFDSFASEGSTLKAYAPSNLFEKSQLDPILEQYASEIETYSVKQIEHQNWNSVWESNYPPVLLDNELFIGAPFHTADSAAKHSIILEPNMSFGTGHHPTTEMMLRAMFQLDLNQKTVLDFGCGSAILSIYADFKNASGIGVEIDEHAAEAARENLTLNNAQNFKIITGGIETIGSNQYDIISANINRNVIEECLQTFNACSKSGTRLLCSGFLEHDISGLKTMLSDANYQIDEVKQIDEWAMIATTYLG
jgi:ribosomal protein L11 methyltransferase